MINISPTFVGMGVVCVEEEEEGESFPFPLLWSWGCEQEQSCYLCVHSIYANRAHIGMLGCAAACENEKFNSTERALARGRCSSSSASFNYCCCWG